MTGPGSTAVDPVEPFTDHELTEQALAADADTPVDDDAVCLWDIAGADGARLLPDWYMPSPVRAHRLLRGWRRRVVFLVILAFLLIDAYGLCSTYGGITLA